MTDEKIRALAKAYTRELGENLQPHEYAVQVLAEELLACREVLRRVEAASCHEGHCPACCPSAENKLAWNHAPGCALKARIP